MFENKIIKSGYVKWKELIPFQNEHFKEMSKDEFAKLEKSFTQNGSLMAWTVWESKDKKYLLDGVGRQLLYEEKEKAGLNPPEKVYCNFLDLKNKKEAAKAVLILSSQYRRITDDGLNEFINTNGLLTDFPELTTEIDLPDFDMDKFIESNFELEPEKDLDEVPAVPKKALSKLGDLFEIDGKHRVLCGDSTKESDVKLLMNGKKCNLIMTSPPYWVGKDYEYQKSEKEIDEFIEKNVKAILNTIDGDFSRIVINSGTGSATAVNEKNTRVILLLDKWIDNFLNHGWVLRHIRLWIKGGGDTIPRSPVVDMVYHGAEFIMTFYKKNSKSRGQNRLSESWCQQENWSDIKGDKNINGAGFPVELPLRNIKLYCLENEIVFDPFLGNGTTLIAAEQNNNIGFGLELDPIYIDVILKRYKNTFPEAKFKCLNRDFDFEKLFLN